MAMDDGVREVERLAPFFEICNSIVYRLPRPRHHATPVGNDARAFRF